MVKIKEMELFRQFNDWFERFKPELRRKFQIGSFFAWGLSIVMCKYPISCCLSGLVQ